jgi:hypothetical protein
MSVNGWMAGAQLAVSFFESYNQRKVDEANDAAAEAVYQARNRVRAAENTAAAGRGDLERFRQSLNNQATRKQAEQYAAALRAQIGAQRDSLAATTFEGRIAAANKAGQTQAQAAAAGVSGGSTALVVGTQQLARARQEFADKRMQEMRDSGLAIQSAATSASSVAGLDQRTIFTTFDRTIESAPRATASGNMLTDLIYAIGSVKPQRLANAAEEAYGAVRGAYDRWTAPSFNSWPDQTAAETARLARNNETLGGIDG